MGLGGLNTWVAVIGGVFAVSLAVGMVFAYARANYARATIDLQQQRIVNLTGALEEERNERKQDQKEMVSLAERVTLLESERASLRELLSGRIDFGALESLVTRLASELTAQQERHVRREDERQQEITRRLAAIEQMLDASRGHH